MVLSLLALFSVVVIATVLIVDYINKGPFYEWVNDLFDKKKNHDVEQVITVDTNMYFSDEKIDELKRQKAHSKEELRNLDKDIKDYCEEKPFIMYNVDSDGNVIESKAIKPKTKDAIFDELRTALDEEGGILVLE